jgi:type III pantothenate kinase
MMGTILLIDIGNTSTTVGLGKGKRIVHRTRLSGGTGHKAAGRALTHVAGKESIEGVAMCSVVPSANRHWLNAAKKLCAAKPLVVTHKLQLGVSIDYPKPATIGADRLANACGAATRYGVPVIVADFGTALTFDIVSPDGAYIGGVIAPGLRFMTDYLAEKTALLPHIKLKGAVGVVGKDTEKAMRIGAKYGYRGMVREIVHHVKDGMGVRRVKLCATGGYARWALEGLDMPFHFDPDLTLYGLSQIYQLNR